MQLQTPKNQSNNKSGKFSILTAIAFAEEEMCVYENAKVIPIKTGNFSKHSR
jgi:hypothetical protein